jgi:predicted Zn-dependent protease
LHWIKIWTLEQFPHNLRLPRYLRGDLAPASMVVELLRLSAKVPDDKTLPYLIGRLLMQAHDPQSALAYLQLAQHHPFLPIESERLRLIAEAYKDLQHYRDAEHFYARYAALVPRSGEQARAQDFVTRMRWLSHPKESTNKER